MSPDWHGITVMLVTFECFSTCLNKPLLSRQKCTSIRVISRLRVPQSKKASCIEAHSACCPAVGRADSTRGLQVRTKEAEAPDVSGQVQRPGGVAALEGSGDPCGRAVPRRGALSHVRAPLLLNTSLLRPAIPGCNLIWGTSVQSPKIHFYCQLESLAIQPILTSSPVLTRASNTLFPGRQSSD